MYPFPYNVYNQGYNQRVPFIIPRPYVDDFIDLRRSNERPYKSTPSERQSINRFAKSSQSFRILFISILMTDNSTEAVDDFVPEIRRSDDYLAAGAILLIASTGLCLNAWNLFYYRRDPRSITYFIRARIVSDMIVSTIFLTYTMPVILFALNDVHSGKTVTKICIILVWLISSSAIWGDTFGEDCVYSFDYTWLSWSYPSSPCGKFAQTYAFLLPAYICNFVTFIINIVICFRLILMKFYLKHTGSQIIKRHNIHARFFIQSGLQFLVFTIDLCMNTFFDEPDDRLITFFYYSLIWMSLHTIDGLIICCFRSKIERRKLEWTPNRIFSTVNNSAIPNHS
ncbi:unnamed protein product, partial [Mesorhabditis belari]|uniref:7TM GPCR serpentine receptor class x (Srx) domain-containing protein n=1 Tax=Mesorhabditis belari TaxID=2138241 RepID=A0AAF3FSF9_9BILA